MSQFRNSRPDQEGLGQYLGNFTATFLDNGFDETEITLIGVFVMGVAFLVAGLMWALRFLAEW
jgi:hypothetical protein